MLGRSVQMVHLALGSPLNAFYIHFECVLLATQSDCECTLESAGAATAAAGVCQLDGSSDPHCN